jgi:hypothetical protein
VPCPEMAERTTPQPVSSTWSSWMGVSLSGPVTLNARFGQPTTPTCCTPSTSKHSATAYCWPRMNVAVPSTGSITHTRPCPVTSPFPPMSIRSNISSLLAGKLEVNAPAPCCTLPFPSCRTYASSLARSTSCQTRSASASFWRSASALSSPMKASSGYTACSAEMRRACAAKSAMVTGESSALVSAPTLFLSERSTDLVTRDAACTAWRADPSSALYGGGALILFTACVCQLRDAGEALCQFQGMDSDFNVLVLDEVRCLSKRLSKRGTKDPPVVGFGDHRCKCIRRVEANSALHCARADVAMYFEAFQVCLRDIDP